MLPPVTEPVFDMLSVLLRLISNPLFRFKIPVIPSGALKINPPPVLFIARLPIMCPPLTLVEKVCAEVPLNNRVAFVAVSLFDVGVWVKFPPICMVSVLNNTLPDPAAVIVKLPLTVVFPPLVGRKLTAAVPPVLMTMLLN